jgi:hypothetical protein
LKRALSHFTLFMKLRAERRLYGNGAGWNVPQELSGACLPLTTQGAAFLLQGLRLDHEQLDGRRFPDVRAVNSAIAGRVHARHDPAVSARIASMENEHFERGSEILERMGMLKGLRKRFGKSFFPEEE